MKIDHDEQVSKLFKGKIKAEKVFDIGQKKFVFKMLNDNKDKDNKSLVNNIWKKYMTMPEEETLKKGTTDPYLTDKEMLVDIIEELQKDNLVMYSAEDGVVILI